MKYIHIGHIIFRSNNTKKRHLPRLRFRRFKPVSSCRHFCRTSSWHLYPRVTCDQTTSEEKLTKYIIYYVYYVKYVKHKGWIYQCYCYPRLGTYKKVCSFVVCSLAMYKRIVIRYIIVNLRSAPFGIVLCVLYSCVQDICVR